MSAPRPIVFLHIPKCAGQSIRAFLSSAFPKRLLFPGQLDQHLAFYSRSDLKQYSIFSGHFSWSMLDFLGEDALFFTVLRNPSDRILSFYTFLRRTASNLSQSDLELSQNRAMKLALTFSFEDFLAVPDEFDRNFIMSNFDNYYTYFFGTRISSGRYLIRDYFPETDYFRTENVAQIAIRNMRDRLRVHNSGALETLISELSKEEGFQNQPLPRINVNPSGATRQKEILQEISKDVSRAEEKLHLMCQFDIKIFDLFCS